MCWSSIPGRISGEKGNAQLYIKSQLPELLSTSSGNYSNSVVIVAVQEGHIFILHVLSEINWNCFHYYL